MSVKRTGHLVLESARGSSRDEAVRNAFLKNAALVVAAIFVGALICELALRLVLPAPITWTYPQESYEYDEEIGHKLHSNQSAFTHDKSVTTNALGLRDVDYAPTPAPGVTRVLALGDSQTFGNGLSLPATWPKQLEEILNARGKTSEVVNAGLPASDTWQHRILFERLSRAYSPQVAVLAVYVNDVTKRYNVSKRHVDSISNTWAKRIAYLLKQSVLLLTLRQVHAGIKQGWEPSASAIKEKSILDGSDNREVEAGWEEVERSIAAMKQSADERGIPLLVVVLPRKDQVDGSEPGLAYNMRMRAIGERLRVPVIDVLSDLKRAYRDRRANLFIPWDGHHSAPANRIIAEKVADAFWGRSGI